jgi:hypothetical protein
MKKIIYTVIAVSFIFSSQADSKIRRFQNKVSKECAKEKVSMLLLKKSLIELIKGQECDAKFTAIVLNKCSSLSCQKLNTIYKEIEQVRSGSVVGEE